MKKFVKISLLFGKSQILDVNDIGDLIMVYDYNSDRIINVKRSGSLLQRIVTFVCDAWIVPHIAETYSTTTTLIIITGSYRPVPSPMNALGNYMMAQGILKAFGVPTDKILISQDKDENLKMFAEILLWTNGIAGSAIDVLG